MNRVEVVKIGNLVIFPEKGEFLLSRRSQIIKFRITKDGAVRIPIKGFENYEINLKNFEIISISTGKALKPVEGARLKSYDLYKNGVKETVPLFKILNSHWNEIQSRFLSV